MTKPKEKLLEICGNCKHFLRGPDADGSGRCHRYPPQVVFGRSGIGSYWPLVRLSDYCGEFKFERKS